MESLTKLSKFPLRKYLLLRYGLTDVPHDGGLYYGEIAEMLNIINKFYAEEAKGERVDLERLINGGVGSADKTVNSPD